MANPLATIMTPKKQHDVATGPEIPRSMFDRTHKYMHTIDAGFLYPVFCEMEVLPGDTLSLDSQYFVRQTTPIKPLMDNIYLDWFFFWVPRRLTWANYRKQQGEQDNPGDSTDFLDPIIHAPMGGYAVGSIFDAFGLPTQTAAYVIGTFDHRAEPFRAYNLVVNNFFRDQNLVNSLPVPTDDGPDVTAYSLFRAAKHRDYFTNGLPFLQKGVAVQLPLGSSAPLKGNYPGAGGGFLRLVDADNPPPNSLPMFINITGGPGDYNPVVRELAGVGVQVDFAAADLTGAFADLSAATATNINSVRQAFQMQALFELDARGGTRLPEQIHAHFGVVLEDFRAQRPELLALGSFPITSTPVPQTSTTSGTPQGNLAAFALGTTGGIGFSKSFTEHGTVLGLIRVRADVTYQQGLDRDWSKRTRFDHAMPILAHLGEQAVLNKEIFCDGSGADAGVFAYVPRYEEYRMKRSQICGEFRSTFSTPLDVWHLSQKFGSLPVFDATFIGENPPMDRVSAVPSEPKFYFDSHNQYRCARPLPVFGVPGSLMMGSL